jgi:dTDP-4-dehydrorhamnose 3,5-epimerase
MIPYRLITDWQFATVPQVIKTTLPGVVILEPRVYRDERGFFLESFRDDDFRAAGIDREFVQDNHSRSQQGVLRGLHYQLMQPQGKLVRVTRGKVFDVAVDIRRGSPHFGQWVAAILDDETHRQMYIPPGFAHGFLVLSEDADFVYKCTDYYHAPSERGIAWNDPDIEIAWPEVGVDYQLSAKDRRNPRLENCAAADLPIFPSVGQVAASALI